MGILRTTLEQAAAIAELIKLLPKLRTLAGGGGSRSSSNVRGGYATRTSTTAAGTTISAIPLRRDVSPQPRRRAMFIIYGRSGVSNNRWVYRGRIAIAIRSPLEAEDNEEVWWFDDEDDREYDLFNLREDGNTATSVYNATLMLVESGGVTGIAAVPDGTPVMAELFSYPKDDGTTGECWWFSLDNAPIVEC